MNEEPIEHSIRDTMRDDPIAMHPGSPRWIFFDDIPPSKEERKARAELIEALEKECANRDPEWVDPSILDYHARMEVRRLEIWMANNYKRMNPDTRNKLLTQLVGLELRKDSYSSRLTARLAEVIPMAHALQAVSKLRLFPLIQDALNRPQVDKKQIVKTINRTRTDPVANYYEGPIMGHWTRIRVFREEHHKFKSKQTTIEPDPKQSSQLNDWRLIHKAMDFPMLELNLNHQPVTRTLFCNPDGTRFLNTTDRERSPVNAREAFARRHKMSSDRVTCSRVHFTKMDPLLLRQLNLQPSTTGHHLWVVTGRKLSDEALTNYYDPNPYLIERVQTTTDEFDRVQRKWVEEYKWSGSTLLARDLAVKKNDPNYHNPKYVPEGMRRLTVREFELAIISGANVNDGYIDIAASSVQEPDPIQDTRDRPTFETPNRAYEAMSDQEQTLYYWLREMELLDLADMLRIDYTDLPQGYNDERSGAVVTILKELCLKGREIVDSKGDSHLVPTELHQELLEFISLNTSSDKAYDTIRESLWDLLESLYTALSHDLRTHNSFTVFETKDD